MLTFVLLLLSIYILLILHTQESGPPEAGDLASGLASYVIVIFIYLIGSGLNVTSVIFTFSAFVGMRLGCEKI